MKRFPYNYFKRITAFLIGVACSLNNVETYAQSSWANKVSAASTVV